MKISDKLENELLNPVNSPNNGSEDLIKIQNDDGKNNGEEIETIPKNNEEEIQTIPDNNECNNDDKNDQGTQTTQGDNSIKITRVDKINEQITPSIPFKISKSTND